MTAAAPAAEPMRKDAPKSSRPVAEIGDFQVTFRIPGRVSLGANEGAKSLRISSATIAPDLAVRAAPVLDPTAFLEASFKQTEDAPLLPGKVAIYRDGIFVGAVKSRPQRQGRDGAARLRRRRQGQDRARPWSGATRVRPA